MNNNIKIVDILEEQLKKGKSATIGDAIDFKIEYGDKDVNGVKYVLDDILISYGYKKPTSEEFYEKINTVFKRKIDYSSTNTTLYINLFNKCNTKKIYYKNNVIDYNGVFVYKNQSFISELLLLPEVISYQGKYPEINSFEKELTNEYMNSDNEKIRIIKWKDVADLDQSRKEHITLLIHRNKYLFNDNKASFTWLKFKDEYFLKSLVLTFGYVEDKELLKWVINKTPLDNIGEYNSLFFMEDCSEKFILHKETFELIKENIQEKYLKDLEEYLELLNKDKQEYELSFPQRSMVIAHIINLGESVSMNNKKYFAYKGKFIEKISKNKEKYLEEFKTKNYYNLKDLKSIIESM